MSPARARKPSPLSPYPISSPPPLPLLTFLPASHFQLFSPTGSSESLTMNSAISERVELAKHCSSRDWSKAIRVLDSLLAQSYAIQDIWSVKTFPDFIPVDLQVFTNFSFFFFKKYSLHFHFAFSLIDVSFKKSFFSFSFH